MPKNIIFCADGTWNGPSDATGMSVTDSADTAGEVETTVGAVTNVFKLFSNLPGNVTIETLGSRVEQERVANDDTGTISQVAKYLHGVGDSNNPIVKLLGGAFGMGVVARIVRGYTFISRNYTGGDRIYLVGFSRGAYTARALAGMTCKVGLLNPATYDVNDKLHAYELGVAAWILSRQKMLGDGQPLSSLTSAMLPLVNHFAAGDIPPNGLIPNIPIKAVGVWDTVGSLGIPQYAGGERLDVFRFADTALNPLVENGFHAMAIDELRADFPVTTWDARSGITQEWFVGAHADVGGGYPQNESGLSNQALSWLLAKLQAVGGRFNNPLPYPPEPQDPDQPIHRPWEEPPFNVLAQAARSVDRSADTFHASVALRTNLTLPPGPPALTPAQVAALSTDPTWYSGRAGG